MDLTFQQTYAPWALRHFGTANHWPIKVQLQAGVRAVVGWFNPVFHRRYPARGFGPWPVTRFSCGV